MVKVISALAVAGVVALGSSASAKNLNGKPSGPFSSEVLDAFKQAPQDGCIRFLNSNFKSIKHGTLYADTREQCLDQQGLTYYTKAEVVRADKIRSDGVPNFQALSRQALVNHDLNQVESCKQMIRTARHMETVHRENEVELLMQMQDFQDRADPEKDDEENEEEAEDSENELFGEAVDSDDDMTLRREAYEEYRDALRNYESEQLKPYMDPLEALGRVCMSNLVMLSGPHCASDAMRFVTTTLPSFIQETEEVITYHSKRRTVNFNDVILDMHRSASAACQPPKKSRGTF